MMMSLQRAADLLHSRGVHARLVGDSAVAVQRVHTDTRSLQTGDLFVALKGENFDAHDFLAQARDAGAVAALAQHGIDTVRLHGLEVGDSKLALGHLAAAWRRQFDLPLIAVTGSNGKTTVTQMVASILAAACAEQALATQSNFNNDIGVPLTLLRLNAQHRMAVVELGMNHPGEIAYLAELAQATVAIVNNAQREHLEFMHTVEAVAQENGAVIEALPQNGVAVFPGDDAYASVWRSLAGMRRCITFAMTGAADVTARAQWEDGAWRVQAATPLGAVNFKLAIAGQHNVKNALAAVAASIGAGLTLEVIARGLESFEAVKGRSRALSVNVRGKPITVVDDTYNANPDSVRAAIDVLAGLPSTAFTGAGRYGRGGRSRARVACRNWRIRSPARYRVTAVHGRADALWRSGVSWSAALRQHGRPEHLRVSRHSAIPQRAGQRFALYANGTCDSGNYSPRKFTDKNYKSGGTPCCLVWPVGCNRYLPSWGFFGCSNI